MKQLISNDNFIAIKISYIFHFLCIYINIFICQIILLYTYLVQLYQAKLKLYMMQYENYKQHCMHKQPVYLYTTCGFMIYSYLVVNTQHVLII